MALPSFLKRNAPASPAMDDTAVVQKARTSARRRLIGAAVLLAIGVISFPLLFETQPRPIPVDIPIEIPRKDGLPPLSAPAKAGRVVSGQVAEEPSTATVAKPSPPSPPVPSTAASVVAVQAAARASAPAPAPAPARSASTPLATKDKPAAAASPAKVASAASAVSAASAASAPAAPVSGRFVVQVGAFADATAARDVRMKVEKLGLKTYTQIVETPQGRRIRVRVGPFEVQGDAVKVLDRLKAAKLPGAVLTL